MDKEKMKQEALKRMKLLGMHPNPIEEFETKGKLNRSDRAILYWLNDEEKEMVQKAEKENDFLVYHVIHSFSNIGETYDMLYVSKYDEEWEDDIAMLKEGCTYTYCYNKTHPQDSEIGTIGIKPLFGGLLRTA